MGRYWSVLSGNESDNIFDLVEEQSLVGVGWLEMGDLDGMDWHQILERHRATYIDASASSAGQNTGCLYRFTAEIEIGDIAVTTIPSEQRMLIGRITGECVFNDRAERDLLARTRRVEWLRTDVSYDEYREACAAHGLNALFTPMPAISLDNYAAVIEQLLKTAPEELPVAQVTDATLRFGLERDMEDALYADLGQLEAGLTNAARQVHIPAGIADIVAVDSVGRIVVIELKAGIAQVDSIAQLLAYMGTVANPEGRDVRGVLIAHDFAPRVRHAVSAVPNVSLRSYRIRFTFSDAE